MTDKLTGSWATRGLFLRLCADGTWHQRANPGSRGVSCYLHGSYTLAETTLVFTTVCRKVKNPGAKRAREHLASTAYYKLLSLSAEELIISDERPRSNTYELRRLPTHLPRDNA